MSLHLAACRRKNKSRKKHGVFILNFVCFSSLPQNKALIWMTLSQHSTKYQHPEALSTKYWLIKYLKAWMPSRAHRLWSQWPRIWVLLYQFLASWGFFIQQMEAIAWLWSSICSQEAQEEVIDAVWLSYRKRAANRTYSLPGVHKLPRIYFILSITFYGNHCLAFPIGCIYC